MIDLSRNHRISAIQLVGLLIFVCAIFAYSVAIRRPWFGEMSEPTFAPKRAWHQWSTGSTVKFAKMWYREGPENLFFGMFENPASIEFASLIDREPYVSYPPGTIIPIYIIAKIIGQEPSHAMVMGYNLAIQFLVALLLGVIAMVVLSRFAVNDFPVTVYSLLPPLIYIFEPSLLFWHQEVFFADQAVLLPFVCIVLLEVLRDSGIGYRSVLSAFQAVLLFYGALTDWLFICIALFFWLKRSWDIRENLTFANMFKITVFIGGPILLALGLFTLQLYHTGSFDLLLERFLIRAGFRADPNGQAVVAGLGSDHLNQTAFFPDFFTKSLQAGVIPFFATIPLLAFLALLLRGIAISDLQRRLIRSIFSLCWITLFPSLLQVFILRNHSVWHEFATQKFWIPFALLTFCLLPYTIVEVIRSQRRYSIIKRYDNVYFHLVPVLITFVFTAYYHRSFRDPFSTPSKVLPVAESVFTHFNYDDVVFSPNFHVSANPPHWMSYTMKRVYWTQTLPEVRYWLDQHSSIHPNLIILFRETIPPDWEPIVQECRMEQEDVFSWCRIPRERVSKIFPPAEDVTVEADP